MVKKRGLALEVTDLKKGRMFEDWASQRRISTLIARSVIDCVLLDSLFLKGSCLPQRVKVCGKRCI
jgi:hypothetical protein